MADVSKAVADRDMSQIGARLERRKAHTGDTVGDRSICQEPAECERSTADVGDAVGNGIAASLTPRTLDKCGLGLVKQDSIHTAIKWIRHLHRNSSQVGAASERATSDANNVGGNRNVGQTDAVLERVASDVAHPVGNDVVVSPFAGGILDKHGLALVE